MSKVNHAGAGTLRQKQSRQPNPTDKVLGCFSKFEQSPRLDHIVRYLSTWSGTDKVTREIGNLNTRS